MANPATQFKPGWKGGPGRPKSGRVKALDVFDKMLAKEGNLKKLAVAFQNEFDKNPLTVWEKFGMPLLLKNLDINHGEIVVIVKRAGTGNNSK